MPTGFKVFYGALAVLLLWVFLSPSRPATPAKPWRSIEQLRIALKLTGVEIERTRADLRFELQENAALGINDSLITTAAVAEYRARIDSLRIEAASLQEEIASRTAKADNDQ